MVLIKLPLCGTISNSPQLVGVYVITVIAGIVVRWPNQQFGVGAIVILVRIAEARTCVQWCDMNDAAGHKWFVLLVLHVAHVLELLLVSFALHLQRVGQILVGFACVTEYG